jgi:hypothetical protein
MVRLNVTLQSLEMTEDIVAASWFLNIVFLGVRINSEV